MKHLIIEPKSILRCPYCQSELKSERLKQPKKVLGPWGIYSCNCDKYPMMEGILYIKKNEGLTNRRIIERLNIEDYENGMYIALRESGRLYGTIIYLIWLLNIRFGIYIPKITLYKVFSKCGPKKGWFLYLSERHLWKDLEEGRQYLEDKGDLLHKNPLIIDVGCGGGHSLEMISAFTNNAIGIDKNFDILLLNRLPLVKHTFPLVCADADLGLPIMSNITNGVVLLSTFSYVFNKINFEKEILRILKPGGFLLMTDVGGRDNTFGYGIDKEELLKLFIKGWKEINIFKESIDRTNRTGRQMILFGVKSKN